MSIFGLSLYWFTNYQLLINVKFNYPLCCSFQLGTESESPILKKTSPNGDVDHQKIPVDHEKQELLHFHKSFNVCVYECVCVCWGEGGGVNL